jgi:isopenicillin N synthase-like dioxygenase
MLTGYPHELVAPDVVLNDRAILSNHVREYHSVGLLLLEAFSDFLKLPYLLEAHKPSEPNASSLTFLKYNAHQPSDTGGHVSHTDIGTLTLLHSSDFGLQVFHPIHQLWQWVAPRPNSLVINVGDSLNLLTGQSLKSSLHRVIPHHQVQDRNRYSFGYFMRPTEKAVLGLVEGESTTSLEWYHKKITLFADSWDVQQNQKELLYGEF